MKLIYMKNISKILFAVLVLGALASCSSHEKCPTYNGKMDIEQPANV